LLLASPSWAKIEMDSNQLMMQNAEQVSELVRKKMKAAQDLQKAQHVDDDEGLQAEPGAIEHLKDAMRLVLSRPADQDGARSNIFQPLRRELGDLNALNDVLSDLTTEAIDGAKDTASPLRNQATYVTLLHNLMAEIKPDLQESETLRKLVEKIRDAKLTIPEKLKSYQFHRATWKLTSPSVRAEEILKALPTPTPASSPKPKK
jgi:hypothetical protein